MPSTLIAPPVEFSNVPRKKWTRDECAQMSSLFDLHHYELIDGELVRKMGKNHPHIRTLILLMEWLQSVFRGRTAVQEIPIDVRPEDNSSSDPEPDAVVLAHSFFELAPIGGDAQGQGADVGDGGIPGVTIGHYARHGFDVGPPAAIFLPAEDNRYRFNGNYFHGFLLFRLHGRESQLRSICSAVFSVSGVKSPPAIMRPSSAMRASRVNSWIDVTMRPFCSRFST